jgi:A/G-specific adenine glycosylase
MPQATAAQLIDARSAFQSALLDWYHTHRRRLPWREAPSVYKTVVSEFMLQQTQVKTVLPYFARWMEALPDFSALAAADEARVLKLWEGLGYYSRARNLHRLARAVVALPELPRTPEDWRELPGIGPYTSAAITSIAFGTPAACVDGNVVRILARLTADDTPHRDSASAARAFASLADAILSHDEPGDHNQAMMELGATVCLRRNPLCTVCPVRSFCTGVRSGDPEAFPRLAPQVIEQRAVTRLWCEREGKLLLHRAAAGAKRLANLHELPAAGDLGVSEADAAQLPVLATRKRGITRFAITETIRQMDTRSLEPSANGHGTLAWVPIDDLPTLTLSGPHRRWVTELLRARSRGIPPAVA